MMCILRINMCLLNISNSSDKSGSLVRKLTRFLSLLIYNSDNLPVNNFRVFAIMVGNEK